MLKRENKLLQDQVHKKEQQAKESQQQQQLINGEDSPPWQRRKSDARLTELEALLREKNTASEQLLAAKSILEEDNNQLGHHVQQLSQQLEQCSSQLQSAVDRFNSLETQNQSHWLVHFLPFVEINNNASS